MIKITKVHLISIIMILVASACSQVGLTSTATATGTPIPLPTETTIPTEIPTATMTLAPTQTVTIVPTRDLSSIKVLGAGPSNGMYLLNFELPGVDLPYLLVVDTIPFKCEVLPQFGERLSCSGPMLPWGKKVNFQFTDPTTGQMVYQMDYTLPAFDYEFGKEVKPICVDMNACPDRGEKFWCETEIRQNEQGYCIVSTCTDVCGFCVGIDTCHSPVPLH